jgi:hypothetical protein
VQPRAKKPGRIQKQRWMGLNSMLTDGNCIVCELPAMRTIRNPVLAALFVLSHFMLLVPFPLGLLLVVVTFGHLRLCLPLATLLTRAPVPSGGHKSGYQPSHHYSALNHRQHEQSWSTNIAVSFRSNECRVRSAARTTYKQTPRLPSRERRLP